MLVVVLSLGGDITRCISAYFFFAVQVLTGRVDDRGRFRSRPKLARNVGVHTHITNTRIGDVEILERRYPVLVHTFGLRQGSGGAGKFSGEGV